MNSRPLLLSRPYIHLNIIITTKYNYEKKKQEEKTFSIDPCRKICGKYFSYPWAKPLPISVHTHKHAGAHSRTNKQPTKQISRALIVLQQ